MVTGSSRGIGRAIALELAQHGANVVINYRRDRAAAEETAALLERFGVRVLIHAADVSIEAEAMRLVDFAARELGRLDVLVCNAGAVVTNLAALQSVADWQQMLDVNLLGAFVCVRSAIPHMISARSGSIVCVSSLAAERGAAGLCSYAAAKGGVNSMVRSLSVELAGKGIRVNAVSPGFIDTELVAGLPRRGLKNASDHIPMARLGRSDEVARAVRFLASDDASYITGHVLSVDGGLGL